MIYYLSRLLALANCFDSLIKELKLVVDITDEYVIKY